MFPIYFRNVCFFHLSVTERCNQLGLVLYEHLFCLFLYLCLSIRPLHTSACICVLNSTSFFLFMCIYFCVCLPTCLSACVSLFFAYGFVFLIFLLACLTLSILSFVYLPLLVLTCLWIDICAYVCLPLHVFLSQFYLSSDFISLSVSSFKELWSCLSFTFLPWHVSISVNK